MARKTDKQTRIKKDIKEAREMNQKKVSWRLKLLNKKQKEILNMTKNYLL